MKYYAKYSFGLKENTTTSYVLKSQTGNVENFNLGSFKGGEKYIRISVPRSAAMRKYFAYTIEMDSGNVLTSIEGLDENKRSFGDAKKIGLKDLILVQFSNDMKKVDLYFLKGLASSIQEKKNNFQKWNVENCLELQA